jgi:hypothetical protein
MAIEWRAAIAGTDSGYALAAAHSAGQMAWHVALDARRSMTDDSFPRSLERSLLLQMLDGESRRRCGGKKRCGEDEGLRRLV